MAKQKKPMKGVSCITREGVKYWYARVGGQKKYCGKGDEGHEIAVAAKAKDIAKSYEDKEVNAGLKRTRIDFKTVKDLSDWYMTLPSVQEQKIFRRKIQASTHLLSYFEKTPLNQVEADTQEQYRQYRRSAGAADGTIDFEISLLSAMYHSALRSKHIPASFMPGQFIIKRERNPRRTISGDEFEALIKHSDKDFADVLTCAYESAMRLSEICDLTAGKVHLDVTAIIDGKGQDVDFIDLGIFDTKNKARRTVPVSNRLKKVLQRRLNGLSADDYVFTNTVYGTQRRWYQSRINAKMRSVCKSAKILYGDKPVNKKGERVGIVFHCFRHTRTTAWIEKGFSDEIIRRATGHKTLEAYRRYARPDKYVVMRLVRDMTDQLEHKESQRIKTV